MIYKLDEQCFLWFRDYAKRLVEKLGLNDWQIEYDLLELSDGVQAECRVNRSARRVAIILSNVWYDEEPVKSVVEQSAQHEVLELLLDDYEAIFYLPELSEDNKRFVVERVRHAIINRLREVVHV